MTSIHIGVKKMIITPYALDNEPCVIMGDNKGMYSKPIFISTKADGISTTIEFSDQPYGYPDLSTMFWTGSAHILVETDDYYVSANDYFKVG